VIKESRYLEIKAVYLQLNAPLLVLAGLNGILWLFSASTKEELKAGDQANEPSLREAQ